jgi:hypothetical protein
MMLTIQGIEDKAENVAQSLLDGFLTGARPDVVANVLTQDEWNTLKSAFGDIETVTVGAVKKLIPILANMLIARIAPGL